MPATIIAKNVIVARAAVTWKLPVAVAPPFVSEYKKLESVRPEYFATPITSKIGIIPIPFAKRIKKKKVSTRGVHVYTHLGPTFGRTIESLIN